MNAIAEYLGFIPVGWETRAILFDGIYYGDVMLQGNEVHIAIAPDRRGKVSRRVIRSFAASLLEQRHFLTTRSRIGDETEPFIQRLGFVQTHEDAMFRYWWLDDLPFNKRGPHHA